MGFFLISKILTGSITGDISLDILVVLANNDLCNMDSTNPACVCYASSPETKRSTEQPGLCVAQHRIFPRKLADAMTPHLLVKCSGPQVLEEVHVSLPIFINLLPNRMPLFIKLKSTVEENLFFILYKKGPYMTILPSRSCRKTKFCNSVVKHHRM